MPTLAIYIHWPFCASKCPYCAFNSYVTAVPDGFVDTYLKKLDIYRGILKNRIVKSIYFGGGTPSLMNPNDIERILSKITSIYQLDNDVEITLEANPGSTSKNKFETYRKIGINRISLGIQSLNDANLKFLGRIHSVKDAEAAIHNVQTIFENYSLDFIYGLPEQNISNWEVELIQIGQIQAPHLSMYQLTIEEDTPFAQQGYLIDSDASYPFYLATREILQDYSYEHYEVSNFAKSGYRSRHNMSYWDYEDFIGIGPGASGRITVNQEKHEVLEPREISIWQKETKLHMTKLTKDEIEEEALIMGLRTKHGVEIRKIERLYTNNLNRINQLKDDQLLQEKDGYLIATEDGLLKLDSLLSEITS